MATHHEWPLASVESLVTIIIMASTAFTALHLSVITGSRFKLILGGQIFKLSLGACPQIPPSKIT